MRGAGVQAAALHAAQKLYLEYGPSGPASFLHDLEDRQAHCEAVRFQQGPCPFLPSECRFLAPCCPRIFRKSELFDCCAYMRVNRERILSSPTCQYGAELALCRLQVLGYDH